MEVAKRLVVKGLEHKQTEEKVEENIKKGPLPDDVFLGERKLEAGDWIKTPGVLQIEGHPIYCHHAIYVGKGKIVGRNDGEGISEEDIRWYQGKHCCLVNQGGQEVADAAIARVDPNDEYNHLERNCEHFASEISGQESRSK